ncbi:hypothetical protein AV530_012719 [Patagioenas fasciata monilis]|uniref:Uncharacterized protein n=1 Tax=Patagioenas fasciata monilis TaxID=372326 RepID=A0A1V4JCJ0_PATFA|nr:hypothetical protein AV530_012719 [Patagioenas fasciata monilis]
MSLMAALTAPCQAPGTPRLAHGPGPHASLRMVANGRVGRKWQSQDARPVFSVYAALPAPAIRRFRLRHMPRTPGEADPLPYTL